MINFIRRIHSRKEMAQEMLLAQHFSEKLHDAVQKSPTLDDGTRIVIEGRVGYSRHLSIIPYN